MRLRRDLVKLRNRCAADWQLLVEAILWLALARSAILTIPFRWTARLFALKLGEDDTPPDQRFGELAQRIGWALRAAASRTPWQSACLAQALAGAGMLRVRRIAATVTFGVARSAGSLEAHAWLSCGGVILTGAAGHERFQVVARFSL